MKAINLVRNMQNCAVNIDKFSVWSKIQYKNTPESIVSISTDLWSVHSCMNFGAIVCIYLYPFLFVAANEIKAEKKIIKKISVSVSPKSAFYQVINFRQL